MDVQEITSLELLGYRHKLDWRKPHPCARRVMVVALQALIDVIGRYICNVVEG